MWTHVSNKGMDTKWPANALDMGNAIILSYGSYSRKKGPHVCSTGWAFSPQQGQTCGERILLRISLGCQFLSRQIPGISCRSCSGIAHGEALSSFGSQRENHMQQPIRSTKRKYKSKASLSRGKTSRPVSTISSFQTLPSAINGPKATKTERRLGDGSRSRLSSTAHATNLPVRQSQELSIQQPTQQATHASV
jgi:hypothetical protein